MRVDADSTERHTDHMAIDDGPLLTLMRTARYSLRVRYPLSWRRRVGPALESWLRRAVAYWLAGEDRPQSGAVLEVPPFFGEGHVSAGAEGVVEQTA